MTKQHDAVGEPVTKKYYQMRQVSRDKPIKPPPRIGSFLLFWLASPKEAVFRPVRGTTGSWLWRRDGNEICRISVQRGDKLPMNCTVSTGMPIAPNISILSPSWCVLKHATHHRQEIRTDDMHLMSTQDPRSKSHRSSHRLIPRYLFIGQLTVSLWLKAQ